jgi:hypothetical protein
MEDDMLVCIPKLFEFLRKSANFLTPISGPIFKVIPAFAKTAVKETIGRIFLALPGFSKYTTTHLMPFFLFFFPWLRLKTTARVFAGCGVKLTIGFAAFGYPYGQVFDANQ